MNLHFQYGKQKNLINQHRTVLVGDAAEIFAASEELFKQAMLASPAMDGGILDAMEDLSSSAREVTLRNRNFACTTM